MFETAELGRKIPKDDYSKQAAIVRADLLQAQMKLKDRADFPLVIVLSGDDRVGLADSLTMLTEWMDARFLQVHALDRETDEERERPEFWRFWRILPPRGRAGIVFGSWYRATIQKGVRDGDAAHIDAACVRINTFEKELVDDGALIVKLWFHLSKVERRKRLHDMEKDQKLRRRALREEKDILRLYDEGTKVVERVLRETSTGETPWTIVEGTDWRWRNLQTATVIRDELTRRLAQKPPAKTKPPKRVRKNGQTILDTLDMTKTIERPAYEKQLVAHQDRLNGLMERLVKQRRSAILVFEGWDAAGKGGIIRRIVPALDARHYHVIPVSAPTEEERAHHYLWRFWRNVPSAGRVTVYDRSWYGRVLVERVEGFAAEHEWKRAYREINDFEEQLCDFGIILLKFWLHIDKDEQLRRFKEREQTPYKNFKITPEDWRNREKWDDYEMAANEMLERTSTEFAPWHLLEAKDKKYARIKALRLTIEAFEAALGNGGKRGR
ncbi:MAG: polyphosphate:AMP phosphotransferase [Deltaproteobacteria bacterium]|nr:polyphosphate:AMP phosphotransferase [Deltaproteobacteria bacterium]